MPRIGGKLGDLDALLSSSYKGTLKITDSTRAHTNRLYAPSQNQTGRKIMLSLLYLSTLVDLSHRARMRTRCDANTLMELSKNGSTNGLWVQIERQPSPHPKTWICRHHYVSEVSMTLQSKTLQRSCISFWKQPRHYSASF